MEDDERWVGEWLTRDERMRQSTGVMYTLGGLPFEGLEMGARDVWGEEQWERVGKVLKTLIDKYDNIPW